MNDKGGATPGGGRPASNILCAPFSLRRLLCCCDKPLATLAPESVPFVLGRILLHHRICQGLWTVCWKSLDILVQELILADVASTDGLLPLLHILRQLPLPTTATIPIRVQSLVIRQGAMRLHPLQHRSCPHRLHGDSCNTPVASGVRLAAPSNHCWCQWPPNGAESSQAFPCTARYVCHNGAITGP